MKKLKINPLNFLKDQELETILINFLEAFNLENISELSIETRKWNDHNTFFYFITKKGEMIEFYYKNNQKIKFITYIEHIKEGGYTGKISLEEVEDKERQEWVDSIWEQFVDHFNLRIRLMFINETTPWNWNTEFTY